MTDRKLGTTGVRVSPFCLGAMMLGKIGNPDHDDGVRIIRHGLDNGINFIDTADAYSRGESEEIVGKAIKGRREEVVVATKFWGDMGGPNKRGNSRRWIIQEVDNSLRRLDTDWIDLYQIHRPDSAVEIEDTLGALSDLVHAGKIRYIGSSTFPADQLVEAHWASERRGLERLRCEQPPYSIFARGIEADILPLAQRYGMGVIPWSPLAGGWLSGRYRRGVEPESSPRSSNSPRFDLASPENQQRLDVVEQLAAIADQAGMPLIHLALAFVNSHPAVTSAIIGPRTMEQLESQLPAMNLVLDNDTLDAIDEVVAPGTYLDPGDAGRIPTIPPASERRRTVAA